MNIAILIIFAAISPLTGEKTFDFAAEVAKARAEGVKRIELKDGVHRMTATVELNERDSGLEITAAPGAKPIIDGGIELENPVVAADGLWEYSLEGCPLATAPFKQYGTGVKSEAPQLFVFREGRPKDEAAEPNEGFYGVTETIDASNYVFRADFPGAERFIGVAGLAAHGYWYHGWADQTVAVTISKDGKGLVFALEKPELSWNISGMRAGRPFRLKGHRSFVDRGNEWYHDRKRGVLVMKPGKANPVVAAWAKPFIVAKGAKNLTLRGLVFRNGGESGIVAEHCDGLVFADNVMENFAVRGLKISETENARVERCSFSTFGTQALAISGGDMRTLRRGGNLVRNNDFGDSGRIVRSASHVLSLGGVGTTVTGNYFHDMPSAAVRMDGIGHLLASNLVERCVTESDDWGAFECYGPFNRDTRVIDNVFRDIGSTNRWNYCGQCGVRLDDMTSNMYIAGNRFINASKLGFGGVQIHAGKENVIENNLFVGGNAAVSETPWPDSFWKERMAKDKSAARILPFSEEWKQAYGEAALRRYETAEPQDNIVRNNALLGTGELLRCRTGRLGRTRMIFEGNFRIEREEELADRERSADGRIWFKPLAR